MRSWIFKHKEWMCKIWSSQNDLIGMTLTRLRAGRTAGSNPGMGVLSSPKMSKPALGLIQSPAQRVRGLVPGSKATAARNWPPPNRCSQSFSLISKSCCKNHVKISELTLLRLQGQLQPTRTGKIHISVSYVLQYSTVLIISRLQWLI
jgi:hypothetical protein